MRGAEELATWGSPPGERQSGVGLAQHGRISKAGRGHARSMLVEAAWATAKAPGPLHAFFVRASNPTAWPAIVRTDERHLNGADIPSSGPAG